MSNSASNIQVGVDRPARLTLRPRDAAEFIGISERTLRKLMQSGEIPYAKVNRAVLIPVSGIESFISRHIKEGAADHASSEK